MNFKYINKFQDGGAVAPAEEGGAPVQGGGQEDPMAMLLQGAAQAVQNQDCNMAMQVCQAFVQMARQAQGGGAPEAQAGEPVYRKGGRLVRRVQH